MKRLLIVTYYWPPSGGSGVQRWLKFSKYLPQYGWQPVIFTPENPDFSIQDEILLKDISPETEIIKHPINEPYSIYRKFFGLKDKKRANAGIVSTKKGGLKAFIANFIRGNFFIPDPKISWVKTSVNFLEVYLKENPVDVMVSTGPPHSMHLIPLRLKKKISTPWIADFRDPWSELDMLKSYHILPFRFKKYLALEQQVLKAADIILTVSKVWENDFKRLGAIRTRMLTNGYDEIDFNVEVNSYPNFVISHFGLINHLRNPKKLWQALAELCEENQEFNSSLKLHFGGTIDKNVLSDIKSFRLLKDKIKLFPYLSHHEVVKEYKKSSVLLLLLFNSESGKGNIPGKLFEYLACKKPILTFGKVGGDAEEIIKANELNSFFPYDEVNVGQLKSSLLSLFFNNKKGLEGNEIEYDNYTRKHLTYELSKLLNEI